MPGWQDTWRIPDRKPSDALLLKGCSSESDDLLLDVPTTDFLNVTKRCLLSGMFTIHHTSAPSIKQNTGNIILQNWLILKTRTKSCWN